MIARKLLCLLMALVFVLATAPLTLAGDTPPPANDDHNIHPWDNNDGHAAGGHAEVIVRPGILFGFGPAGQLFWVHIARVGSSASTAAAAKPSVTRSANRLAKSRAVGR
jgi:hypothetical protein